MHTLICLLLMSFQLCSSFRFIRTPSSCFIKRSLHATTRTQQQIIECKHDSWKSLQQFAKKIQNPLVLYNNTKENKGNDKITVASSFSFKSLSNRRTWKLIPVPSENENNECKWVLFVSKRTTFNLNDTNTVIKLSEEVKQCQYDLQTNTFKQLKLQQPLETMTNSSYLSQVNGQTLPPWLLVVLVGGSTADYRAAASLRMVGLDVWPLHRYQILQTKTPMLAQQHPSSSLSSTTSKNNTKETLKEKVFNKLENLKGTFEVVAPYEPTGDQPDAIRALCKGLDENKTFQTLMGATGTGKTFMMANIIKHHQRPTLVLAPNKVLAAQLYNELSSFFPNNAVEYFVSFYDYYMPESYSPVTDRFVDKVTKINDDIDRLRHRATRALLERRDTIVVASVSCIYGLGMPQQFMASKLRFQVGSPPEGLHMTDGGGLPHALEAMSYERSSDNEGSLPKRGQFSVSVGGGEVLIGPASDELLLKVQLNINTGLITSIETMNATATNIEEEEEEEAEPQKRFLHEDVNEKTIKIKQPISDECELSDGAFSAPTMKKEVSEGNVDDFTIYPARHHVLEDKDEVLANIRTEMEERCEEFKRQNTPEYAVRLRQRTENDLLMLQHVDSCKGIENYSRHLSKRKKGEAPECIVGYFPKDDWLLLVDESHVSAPQIKSMYEADQRRKQNLVNYGYRLPSALDNRPLKAQEFWKLTSKTVFVSATPSMFEKALSFYQHPTDLALESKGRGGRRNDDKNINKSDFLSTKQSDQINNMVVSEKEVHVEEEDQAGWWDAEAVIRPTGIVDPKVSIRPSKDRVADLLSEIKKRSAKGERVLVTTLTKAMAEDLDLFFQENGVRSGYLHSGVKPLERLRVLRSLRQGSPISAAALQHRKLNNKIQQQEQEEVKKKDVEDDSGIGGIDVLVGVNLLREGLNLPEVSLVAILDADKEGFLRSDTALIQTIGRATRHLKGEAIFYADKMTRAMHSALDETSRRRKKQLIHNEKMNIQPTTPNYYFPTDQILAQVKKNEMLNSHHNMNKHDNQQDEGIDSDNNIHNSLNIYQDLNSRLSHAILSASFEGDVTSIALEIKVKSQKLMEAASNNRQFKEAAKWRDLRDSAAAACSVQARN